MANSTIHNCTDCLEPFCETCDFNSKRCPDCEEMLCEACADLSLDTRRGRCYSCDDPELSDTSFPRWVREGRMKKRWSQPG